MPRHAWIFRNARAGALAALAVLAGVWAPEGIASGVQGPTASRAHGPATSGVQGPTASGACEDGYTPQLGQPGKDVAWRPTSEALIERMLQAAQVKPTDVVYDLGAGDGRIVIDAARQFGAKSVGIEYDPRLVQLAKCRIAAAGLSGRASIIQGDLFRTSFDQATVITLYLLPDLDLRLRAKLLALKPGTRIVSHSYLMGDWQPDRRIEDGEDTAWLWIVPAHVDGEWTFTSRRGQGSFKVTFVQTYQHIEGLMGDGVPLESASLRGAHLAFSFTQGGESTQVNGEVIGSRIEAKVTRKGRTVGYFGTPS